jgi:hypothetical protein
MMNLLNSRLRNAGLIVSALALLPSVVFAQDVATATMSDNASNFIGGLVIWLLPVGGAFAVFVMFASDKSAQQGRARR